MEWCVYVMESGGRRKIGFSRDVQRRLTALQTGCADQIEIDLVFAVMTEEAARKIERAAHKALRFAGLHARGEWFEINSQMARNVIRAAAKQCGGYVCELVYSRNKEVSHSKKTRQPVNTAGVQAFLKAKRKRDRWCDAAPK